MKNLAGLVLSVIWLIAGASGCGVLKASPARSSEFLPYPEKLFQAYTRAPFHGIWYKDEQIFTDFGNNYSKLVVLPVLTAPAKQKIEKSALSPKAKLRRQEELKELARYMFEKFRAELSGYPGHSLQLAEEPAPGTVVLELAVTEVKPTKAAVNLAGTAVGALIPGLGLVRLAAKGSIAIEGILRDGGNGEVLLTFKDREIDKSSPFNIKDFQEYAHIRAAIDEWSAQFIELMVDPTGHKVKDSPAVTLSPL